MLQPTLRRTTMTLRSSIKTHRSKCVFSLKQTAATLVSKSGVVAGIICMMLLAFAGQVQAQLSTATIFGTVTDSTGAVIARATVTFVQTDTNFTRATTSKEDGSYRAEFLPVGPYRVEVD